MLALQVFNLTKRTKKRQHKATNEKNNLTGSSDDRKLY